MKKFLKAIISIAIVVALVLGVSYLVTKNKDSEFLFTKLEAKQQESSVRTAYSEEGFENLVSYIQANPNKFDDTVNSAVAENGELTLLRKVYASCDTTYDYFTQMLAITFHSNNSAQNSILSNYDKLVKQIQTHKNSLHQATIIIQNASSFNKVDFKVVFDEFLSDYSKSVQIYSTLCNDISQYILKNAFNGFTTNYEFVIYTICAKTNLFACENHNLLEQNKLMQDNVDYYLVARANSAVNAFLQIDDIDDFIKSEDKVQFIQSKENKSPYQELNNLFREV